MSTTKRALASLATAWLLAIPGPRPGERRGEVLTRALPLL